MAHEVTDYMREDIQPIMKAQHGAGFKPEEVSISTFKTIDPAGAYYGIFVCRVIKLL